MMNKTIISFVFLAAFQAKAQKITRHQQMIEVSPVVIKFDESLDKKDCKADFENQPHENSSNKILSFNAPEYKKEGQIDPQIAVGGSYVLQVSNAGASIYDKSGDLKSSVYLSCLTKSYDALDPKLFFDKKNNFFGLGVWDNVNDKEQNPMRLLFSQSNNPLLNWNMYNIPAKYATDGGSIGYGEKWILYRFDGEDDLGYDHAFVINSQEVKNGKTTKVYKFDVKMGQPLYNQDHGKAYALGLDPEHEEIFLQSVEENNGIPNITELWRVKNNSPYQDYPLFSAQKGSDRKVSSGDFKPKNGVVKGNSVWFCHAVDKGGNSAIEWFELSLPNAKVLQRGLIAKKGTNYIQPSIGVNNRGDMAIGFQETNKNMYISTRLSYRLASDKLNTTRTLMNVEEGDSSYSHYFIKNTELSWGDYSSTVVDADNGLDFWFAQSYSKDKKVKVNVYRLKL